MNELGIDTSSAELTSPAAAISLRIALTADPELPVPPLLYGGIERVIDLLARGLVDRGHEVTLFAHKDSTSAGRLVPWPGAGSRSRTDTIRNAAALAERVWLESFDLVHSFSRLAYLTPLLPWRIPKIMSYQREVSRRTTTLAHRLSRGSLSFTAVGNWMIDPRAHAGEWSVIPNGVPVDRYRFRPDVASDAPLVFLGRVEEIKGPHLAIEIARQAGRHLIIAGNIPADKALWFESHVRPHVDGVQIQYIGAVDDKQKDVLLGQAAALLMPILWEEPFGIVMAEALACGTPILGLRRGAVSEVVEDGVTGFVRDTPEQLADCVADLRQIARSSCRAAAVKSFSSDAVVESYLKVYWRCLGFPKQFSPI